MCQTKVTEQITKCRECFPASIFTNIKGSLEGNWKEREEGKLGTHGITMPGDKPCLHGRMVEGTGCVQFNEKKD